MNNKPIVNITYGKPERKYKVEHKSELMNKGQKLFDNDLFAWSFTIFGIACIFALATWFTGGWAGIKYLLTLI